MNRRGGLVVLAGCDGCGKDTQADRLVRSLDSIGAPHWRTHEPWTSHHGMKIRSMLREATSAAPLDPVEMALLFAADRRVHRQDIDAWISKRGAFVITTRYVESSVVYQGAQLEACGIADGTVWVRDINRMFPPADLTVVLDVDPEKAAARVRSRGTSDAYERDADLQRLVAVRYAKLGDHIPGRIVHVDAGRDPDVVAADVWRAFSSVFIATVDGGAA